MADFPVSFRPFPPGPQTKARPVVFNGEGLEEARKQAEEFFVGRDGN